MADLDREKNVILGVVAHDLRTPLTSIRGWAEALCQVLPPAGSKLTSERRRQLEDGLARIVERSQAMATLVGRLLGASAIEAGRLSLDVTRVALWPIVQAVVDPNEPPLPGNITMKQALKFAEALLRGEKDRWKIIKTVLEDKIREVI